MTWLHKFFGLFLFQPTAEPNRPNSWFRWCCHSTPIFSMVRDTGMETKIWFLKVFDPIALCCYVTARCDYRRRRRNDEKNVILPLKFSLKGALSHTVVPTLPWLLSHHIFGHIYIFTASFFLLLQACTMTWFEFSNSWLKTLYRGCQTLTVPSPYWLLLFLET